MLSIKPGVKLAGIKAELLMGLMVLHVVLDKHGFDTVVTEGTGGHHMFGSLHYRGLAFDIRSKHIDSAEKKKKVLAEAKEALGKDYDLLLENEGEDNEHLHIEFQART